MINESGAVVHACDPSHVGGRGRRIQGQPWKKEWETLTENISKIKGLGRAQMVDHLPTKHWVLSSNLSTTQKKRKKRKRND